MAIPDIVAWAESKHGFYTDRTYDEAVGRWIIGKQPVRLSDYHKDILRHCFTVDEAGKMPYDTVCICESAKSGKSMLGGLIAEYFALHIEPGSEIYCIANKLDQAQGKVFRSLTDSIDYNPFLPNIEPNRYNVTFRNGTDVKAIPSAAKTEAGARFSLAVFDEPWGIITESEENVVAEFKVDPTRNVSCRVFVGYGGYENSRIWKGLLEGGKEQGQPLLTHIRNSDGSPACYANGRLFVYWSDHPRQPWQTVEWVDSFKRVEKLTDVGLDRMVYCRFVESTIDQLFQAEWWQACYDPALHPIAAGNREPLVAALDLALGTKGGDYIALAAVSPWRDGWGIRYCKAWKPAGGRFDYHAPGGIAEALWWLIRNANLMQLAYDNFQAHEFVTNNFKGSVWCKEFSQGTQREIADRYLYDLIINRKIAHFGDEDMTSAILATGADFKGENRMRLVKSGRRKIDLAVAASMACYRASTLNLSPGHNKPKPGEVLAAESPSVPSGPVQVEYIGKAAGSHDILTTEGLQRITRGERYVVPFHIWENIQQFNRREWQRIDQ